MGVRTRVSIIDFIIKKMRRAIAIVEDTDTASRNIASGKYVLWKGVLTKASTAISSGTTLSSSNLTSLDDGAINDLDERINEKINTSAIANNLTTTAAGYVLDARQGKTINDRVSNLFVIEQQVLTFSSGVATISAKSGYLLVNAIAQNRTEASYSPSGISLQTNGSYKVLNCDTGLSASLQCRLFWIKS